MKKVLKSKIFMLTACVLSLVCGSAGVASFFSAKTNIINVATTNTISLDEIDSAIPIAMATDNNYTYPTLVAITSLMENSKKDTHYDIYIMTPGEFAEENKGKLLCLQEKYDNCKIILIDMQDKYKNANNNRRITTPAYYRLSLSSLLPNVDKIIWLDGDTLILSDLTEMINIGMEGLYYRGFLDDNVNGAKVFGVDDDHYICSGVMLINLDLLRQDNMEERFETFIKENNENLSQHDQTVINVVCHEKIGALPPKYGIWNFTEAKWARYHSTVLIAKNKYTEDEMQEAFENPAVLHCIWKPWRSYSFNSRELWLSYAEKTGYIDEIKAKYQIS